MPPDASFHPGDAWEPDTRTDAEKFGAEPFAMLDLSAMLRMPKPRFRINGVLPDTGLAILFGKSGSKKSFVAIDWACHIAHGMDWQGRKTRKCGVLYVAGEDGYGVGSQRIPGWHIDQLRMGDAPPLRLIDFGVDVTDAKEVNRLIASIKKAVAETGFDVGMVVIDTLARSFGARDENSGEAMALFLKGCKDIQREINGLVLVVHHSGWNDASRTRGHSSLWAATDARYQSDSDPGCREIALKVLHLKNGESGAVYGLHTHTVELGQNDDGEMISTLVLKKGEAPSKPHEKTIEGRQKDAFGVLVRSGTDGLTYSEWWDNCRGIGIKSKATFDDARKALLKKGYVRKEEARFFPDLST